MAFDPLSSIGILAPVSGGQRAADAVIRAFDGDDQHSKSISTSTTSCGNTTPKNWANTTVRYALGRSAVRRRRYRLADRRQDL
jgi:hypothetical protein